ncbi:hypothetical protein EV690_2879 [Celerinatantimonas diazotrophica]|uniref:Uncharacterized protein n=1 Tax=Celerinatantimonas diazotrophica TaxID=412034 RepID=A0A4R1J9C1_9GAMM|nr:hypothetical protein EV690_2879 [Celerinatantimonas diazotrophica]CAG9295950.1 hypothetical protein CEDIAZO_01084 [Celerinatantimonas diazotrophica]
MDQQIFGIFGSLECSVYGGQLSEVVSLLAT